MAVYFLKCETTGLVKIGFADEPIKRVRCLQTQSSTKLVLLCVVEGDRSKERELHRLHHLKWRRGEWFALNNSDIPPCLNKNEIQRFNNEPQLPPSALRERFGQVNQMLGPLRDELRRLSGRTA
jgi:hypothetical protein